MTTKNLFTTNDQHTPSARAQSIPHAPPDIRPSVTVALPASQVVAGAPTTITAETDPGARWVWNTHGLAFGSQPIVIYGGKIRISVDGVQAAGGSGGTT